MQEAEAVGKVPKLCRSDSMFNIKLRLCRSCHLTAAGNAARGNELFAITTLDDLQQFLDYCSSFAGASGSASGSGVQNLPQVTGSALADTEPESSTSKISTIEETTPSSSTEPETSVAETPNTESEPSLPSSAGELLPSSTGELLPSSTEELMPSSTGELETSASETSSTELSMIEVPESSASATLYPSATAIVRYPLHPFTLELADPNQLASFWDIRRHFSYRNLSALLFYNIQCHLFHNTQRHFCRRSSSFFIISNSQLHEQYTYALCSVGVRIVIHSDVKGNGREGSGFTLRGRTKTKQL